MIRQKSIANLLAAASLGSLLFMPSFAAIADEEVHNAGSVSYVSGGVATDSLDRLAAMAKEFNVKLVFAMQTGEFLSDVKVTIADASGHTMLDTVSEGPWLLAKLPQGNYQVVAVSSGKAIKKPVGVSGSKLSTVDFRWQSE